MKFPLAAFFVLLVGACAVAEQAEPVKIFIRAGPKTHGPGEHDYPQFLADWTKLLNQRGAITKGSLTFPRPDQLERVDVIIIYAPDGGTMNAAERKTIDAFTERGGGLVVLHDGICCDDADWFKSIIGGAKQHGVTNWRHGKLTLNFMPLGHAITKGLADFEMDDELFYQLHLLPDLTVLATAVHDGEKVPQLWCYEKSTGERSYRAFVSLQGHNYRTFSLTPYRGLILRGIAWAGKREVDLLTQPGDLLQ